MEGLLACWSMMTECHSAADLVHVWTGSGTRCRSAPDVDEHVDATSARLRILRCG